jgi:hypothetical protein
MDVWRRRDSLSLSHPRPSGSMAILAARDDCATQSLALASLSVSMPKYVFSAAFMGTTGALLGARHGPLRPLAVEEVESARAFLRVRFRPHADRDRREGKVALARSSWHVSVIPKPWATQWRAVRPANRIHRAAALACANWRWTSETDNHVGHSPPITFPPPRHAHTRTFDHLCACVRARVCVPVCVCVCVRMEGEGEIFSPLSQHTLLSSTPSAPSRFSSLVSTRMRW